MLQYLQRVNELREEEKLMEIRIPLQPQPVKDADGMWHWKDCQWMDGGIGFPESGIEDHCMFHRDDLIVIDDTVRRVMFVTVAQDVKGTWNWGVFIKASAYNRPKPRVRRHHNMLLAIAGEIAQDITIRTYVNGSSKDEKRMSTKEEREILQNIIYSTLLALNDGEEARRAQYCGPVFKAALDVAEYITPKLIPDVNTYDSIYCPIWNVVKDWPLEGEE